MARMKKISADTVKLLDDQRIYRNCYYIPKRSGTITDVLLACGFAAIVHEILRQAKGVTGDVCVQIEDLGSWYGINLNEPLKREWVENCSYFTVAKAVRTSKADVGTMSETDLEDYDEAWIQIQEYLNARQARHEAENQAANSETEMSAVDLATLDSRKWITVFIGNTHMQALSAYNDATRQWWETQKYFLVNLKAILALFAEPFVDTDAVIKAWQNLVPVKVKLKLTASQMLNPHCGKGQNRTKANALIMDNIKSFWLMEYLKAAGFWRCAVPRRVRDCEDRKTYVLSPGYLSLTAHEAIFMDFSKRLWSETSIKMDCVASLLYTQLLLKYSEAKQYDELAVLFGEKSIKDIVAGFYLVHYKKLSQNAYTMINLGFMGLPKWIGLMKSPAEVRKLEEVLYEHLRVLQTIDEGHTDVYGLLVNYRDFLSSNRWENFFYFIGSFAGYLMRELDKSRKQGQKPKVRTFTTSNLEAMIMHGNKVLVPIVRSSGFQHIARAIRQSTVTLQYLASKEGRSSIPYEIRYGLGQELLHKANRNDEFLTAISEFVLSYNAENARIAEKRSEVWRREAITGQDLDDLVQLVDEYGANTIAHLLVAYGYARETKEEQ